MSDEEKAVITYMDDTPVPEEEIASVRERLQRGEMRLEFAPSVIEDLERLGLSKEDLEAFFLDALGVKKN